MRRYRELPPPETVSPGDLQRGLQLEDDAFGDGTFDEADATEELDGLPEYKSAVSLYRTNMADAEQDGDSAEDKDGYLDGYSVSQYSPLIGT